LYHENVFALSPYTCNKLKIYCSNSERGLHCFSIVKIFVSLAYTSAKKKTKNELSYNTVGSS